MVCFSRAAAFPKHVSLQSASHNRIVRPYKAVIAASAASGVGQHSISVLQGDKSIFQNMFRSYLLGLSIIAHGGYAVLIITQVGEV